MARKKNALTEHYIGEVGEEATLRLAHRVQEANDATDEETEDYADYAGDGTPTTDVINVKKSVEFVGQYDSVDAAMKFVADREFDIANRKIVYKQVRPDGTTLVGPATLSNIVVSGGEATAWQPFQCTISWDAKPTITNANPSSPAEEPQG